MTVGTPYVLGWREYLDPLIGQRVRHLTGSPTQADRVSFYTPSVMPDGEQVSFTYHRAGGSDGDLTNWDGEL